MNALCHWSSLLDKEPTIPAQQPCEKDLGGPPMVSPIEGVYSHFIKIEHLLKQLILLKFERPWFNLFFSYWQKNRKFFLYVRAK